MNCIFKAILEGSPKRIIFQSLSNYRTEHQWFQRNIWIRKQRVVQIVRHRGYKTSCTMSVSPYGTWKSPITSQLVTASGVTLQELRVDFNSKNSNVVYWTEARPEEKGRSVVCSVDKSSGKVQTWTPEGFNVRSTVHEYGGGTYFVNDGAVYFSNFTDQQLYIQKGPSEAPEAVVDTARKWRYADGTYSEQKSRIYSIREDHEPVEEKKAKEPTNTIVSINPATKTQSVLVSGNDFYSCPQASPDGKKLCWMEWCHPNMPWDSTEVWTADLSDDGDSIVDGSKKKIAGETDLSAITPGWTPDNELLYIGDQTDWWNLYHVTESGDQVNVLPRDVELGEPHWQFCTRSRTYCCDPTGSGKVVTTYGGELGIVDLKTKVYEKITTEFESHKYVGLTISGDLYCIASSPTRFPCVVRVNVGSKQVDVLHESRKLSIDNGYFSVPETITWPTANGEVSHGYFYPPKSKEFVAPEGTLPPLLVKAHGGPTAKYSSTLNIQIQYFTSRGFAVLTVDYRGSTGYGKKYRHRLRGNWGICDVEDCCSGALYLAEKKRVDGKRLCIDGGSAGGYTTLACLTFRKEVFHAGASHYGVADCLALAEETHKFESRYTDTLLAPLTESGIKLLKERSPINYVQNLSCPCAFFQGDEDKIVLPNQAVMMYEAVKKKKLPTVLVMFEGEQHGFRKAENIQKALDGEFYFFGKVFGFKPADDHCKLDIDNMS
ncbi:uncharacterized protein LOC124146647 [Haliotis rufescens]|uniref:uncharacterized protein LOC124146647 n=1 Tax=Haliotis rufescens TaxID=6454 RepID=UPI00201F868E|nr:uncharacterized protein LOC124146647 [Haliotis rufescens]